MTENLIAKLGESIQREEARIAALEEVMHWAQAVLTALNTGDVKSGCPLHLKLRKVLIAYREKMNLADPPQPSEETGDIPRTGQPYSRIIFPIDIMDSAPWNILDASGCRIAWCGFDGDHEKSGPPIARRLVELAMLGLQAQKPRPPENIMIREGQTTIP